MDSTQAIPGTQQISGRKRAEAGTTNDKSLCLPVARVLLCAFKHGCVWFSGAPLPPRQHRLLPGRTAYFYLDPYSV